MVVRSRGRRWARISMEVAADGLRRGSLSPWRHRCPPCRGGAMWDTERFQSSIRSAHRRVGGAVLPRFSVGNGVLWADVDAGVAATQAIVDVGYGPKALELLRKGLEPRATSGNSSRMPIRSRTMGKQGRQFAVMNLKGRRRRTPVEGDRPGGSQGAVRDRAGQHPAGSAVVDNAISGSRDDRAPVAAPVAALEGGQAGAATSAGSSRRGSDRQEELRRGYSDTVLGSGRRQPGRSGIEAARRPVERAQAQSRRRVQAVTGDAGCNAHPAVRTSMCARDGDAASSSIRPA